MPVKVLFKRLDPKAVPPAYARPDDAGMDLCTVGEIALAPGERKLVPTGWAMALPAGYEAQVRARSGMALKRGLAVLNAPGTIDAGYRGEIGVILYNASQEAQTVRAGERIAQLVIAPVVRAEVAETAELDETARGKGGFGSTGS